jgi:hypothetical protein
MSPDSDRLMDLEQHSRVVLEESVLRIDGRVRSRLNQARQAAVAEAANVRRPHFFGLMPAAVAAAALFVTMVLWHRAPQAELPLADGAHPAIEDLDLLADGEGLDLMEEGDNSFYEWAVEQADASGAETG